MLSKIKKRISDFYYNFFMYISSKKKKEQNICFLCQCEYIWNKIENVFAELQKNNVKSFLYIVEDNSNTDKCHLTIFEKAFPDVCFFEKSHNLKSLRPSTVFYTRPYQNYLPKKLRVTAVMKYAKIGYIPYYFCLSHDNFLKNDFLSMVNIFFPANIYEKNDFDEEFKTNIRKGLQSSYYCGFPSLEKAIIISKKRTLKPHNKFRLMWTPRWKIDDKIGGSNFLKLYEIIFEFCKRNDDIELLFRPHPLMFSSFLNDNIISENEYKKIMFEIENTKNIVYNKSNEYLDIFNDIDLLITDISSIMAEYFFFNKPMIYCSNNCGIIFNDFTKEILSVNYTVSNENELFSTIQMLKFGNDVFAKERTSLVNKLSNENIGSSIRISKIITDNC